jgi:hypothetical protein
MQQLFSYLLHVAFHCDRVIKNPTRISLIVSYLFDLCFFVLCLVYPMLLVSLNCPFLIALRYSLTFIYYIFIE